MNLPSESMTRSLLYRTLTEDGAQFTTHHGKTVVKNFGGDLSVEIAQAKVAGIFDLSTYPRTGFKGQQALRWLQQFDHAPSGTNNRAIINRAGNCILRLADTEAVVLGCPFSKENTCDKLNQQYALQQPEQCYRVPRQDSSAWLMLSGDHSVNILNKVCAIDFATKNFPLNSVAQTSVAKTNSVVLRHEMGSTSVFHVLFDSASSPYMWLSLRDAMTEFSGTPLGHDALEGLVSEVAE